MALGGQSILVKTLFLLVTYIVHGRPFEGAADYGYALLVVYFLLFGVLRDRIKPILVTLGLAFLALGHFVPQLAIPEYQRSLMDDNRHLISPNQFLQDVSKHPYSLTADGYLQGYKNKRFVRTIDIDGGILSLRSGWINRREYNFYPPVSSYVRANLPFVVCYGITPQMVGMSLTLEGMTVLEKGGQVKAHDPAIKTLWLQDAHVGSTLCGFGGQWDDTGYHNLKIELEKTRTHKFYDTIRWGSFLLGLGLFFFGVFLIHPTVDLGLQSLFLFLSGLSFFLDNPSVFRWGVLAKGGMDGIIHGGFPYWMLERWAEGNWGAALMSPEPVFYFMPGMRYVRFLEMLLFGDAYILQVCLLIFTPVIFYRFFSLFLSRIPVVFLCCLSFAHLFNGIGVSLKIYRKMFLDLYGEGVAYALLLIAITLLAKSIQKIGWGLLVFFLFAISLSIRPNLAVFVGVIGGIHLFTRTFSELPWTSRFIMLFGLAPTLLIPVHNILGGEFILLTKASTIQENLSLSPWAYVEGIQHVIGLNKPFTQGEKFIAHFRGFYPQYILAWAGCLWLSFKERTPVARSFAFAAFAGLSVHFFYLPNLRYLHPYLTIAVVLWLSQVPWLRIKENCLHTT